jgi:hypothetical protein
MKIRFIVSILLFGASILNGQNHWDFMGGLQSMNPKAWNRTIQAYNFSRVWQNEPMPELRSAMIAGLGFNGVLLKGVYISPQLQYGSFRSLVEQESINTLLRLRWASGIIAFDLFPLEFGLDTVRYRFRPFVRLGAGASLVMPRFLQNDSLVSVNGTIWQPMVWPFFSYAAVGIRVSLNHSLGIVLLASHHFFPEVRLPDYTTAVHGTALPSLKDKDKIHQWNVQFGFSLRLHPTEEDDDKKEEDKKLKRRRF